MDNTKKTDAYGRPVSEKEPLRVITLRLPKSQHERAKLLAWRTLSLTYDVSKSYLRNVETSFNPSLSEKTATAKPRSL